MNHSKLKIDVQDLSNFTKVLQSHFLYAGSLLLEGAKCILLIKLQISRLGIWEEY